MPLAKTAWAKVFILFLLLGFWRTGQGQTVFNNPVGINTTPAAGTWLHTNGAVRMQGLPASIAFPDFLSIDVATGELFTRTVSTVPPATLLGESLYWDNISSSWQPNSFLRNTPTGVGVNTFPAAGMSFHVDGRVQFDNLNQSTWLPHVLGYDVTTGEVTEQELGIFPGFSAGQTLYWDMTPSASWQPTDFLRTEQGIGVGIDLPTGFSPLDKLHIDDASGIGNFARWTNSLAPNGGRIGQPPASPVFQIIQNELADMKFLAGGATVAYMNNINGGFLGVQTPGPLFPTVGYGGTTPPAAPAWVLGAAPAIPMFSVLGDITTLGNYFGNNIYIFSDERMKQNITKLPDWKRIFEIQPYTYKYKEQEHNAFSYGFMAQDVYKTLPELTSGWGEALSVNYIGFIPFLSQGLKEHEERLNAIEQRREIPNAEIEELKVEIEELKIENGELKMENQDLNIKVETLENENEQVKSRLDALEEKFNAICNLPCIQNNPTPNGNGFGQTGTLGEPPALEQNEPNPFSETTVIRYFLPEGAVNAKIEVRNTENKVVGSFPLSQAGHGNITLSAGTLAAGNYFYSLIINNNIIDTKKMILLN